MIEEAVEAVRNSSATSKIYIGCDSKVSKRKCPKTKRTIASAKYTTVVVVHIDGCHGGRIFGRSVVRPDYGNTFTRMMQEVYDAVEVFEPISQVLGDRPLEIHLDINKDKKHKSNVAMQAAIGYVRGTCGVDPKIKPEAWAAAHAADHMVRR